MSIKKLGKTPV